MGNNNYQQVKKILWQILFANLLVAAVKIFLGYTIRSTSLTADGFHSLTDGLSNVVGLIGIAVASAPVDSKHPYGHQKFEFITSLFLGGMLIAMAGRISIEAVGKIISPTTPVFAPEFLLLLVATVIINIIVYLYENHEGKRLDSFILIADSLHTKSDIFVSLGVLATLIGIKLGAPPIIDPLASLVVCGFIIHSGLNIILSTAGVLVDRAAIDHDLIKNLAMTFPQVINVHEIRSRGTGSGMFVDMHIIVAPEMTIREAHNLVHEIEVKLRAEISPNLQTIIHTEPDTRERG